MDQLIADFEKYLLETIGLSVKPHLWQKADGLPYYLRERYRFYQIEILGKTLFLMADIETDEMTPGAIGKHLELVRAQSGIEVIFVRSTVTPYKRRRLIEQKIPFVVPGNQMYLPMLGIDLREHMKRHREKREIISPSTQALILHILNNKTIDVLTPASIASQLGYSVMTMSRAFNELESIGIGEPSVRGKWRQLRISEAGKALWEKALPYLKSPVRNRTFVATSVIPEKADVAGLSALGRYTMLAEPRAPVYAISSTAVMKRLRQDKLAIHESPESWSAELELWKYMPCLFSKDGIVDRLSLYLSLRDSEDERIQSALEALLAGMTW